MKFCGKCGQKVDSIKCPFCNFTQDKTYIAFKIKHSKKRYFFVGTIAITVLIVFITGYWAVNDGHGPLYDRGDFILQYEQVIYIDGVLEYDLTITTEENQLIDDIVRQNQYFENLIIKYNDQLKLPKDIPFIVGECGESNAFWLYTEDKLVICYELIAAHFILFRLGMPDLTDEELTTMVFSAVDWTVVHELGHAVMDIYDLPSVGNQEDAADAAANILLISEGSDGVQSIIDSAYMFKLENVGRSNDELINSAGYDTHGLNVQRWTDMFCFIYGSDAAKYGNLVWDGHLHPDKAVYCEKIFQENFDGWSKLLEPYMKYDL